ncbi:MAG: DUF4147 domain-containing protein [Polyangiaceae bacterium]
MDSTRGIEGLAGTLRRIWARSIAEIDIASRVRRVVRTGAQRRVLAVGKAATTMLAGAWSESVTAALLIVPEGSRVAWASPKVTVLFASHPHPTAASVAAAEAALAFARSGIDLALVSGGSSSLLAAPIAGLSLDDKRAIVSRLMAEGLPITTINVARRHMSRVKGGRLAAASPTPIRSVALSDVIDGQIHDIGSGPTVADPTTIDDARRILSAYGIEAPLEESLKREEAERLGLEGVIVAKPEDLAEKATMLVADEGLTPYSMPPATTQVEELAAGYIGLAQALLPGQVVVRVAEPVLKVTTAKPGRGGRSTHLCALVGPRLPKNTVFFAAGSDGVDGTSGMAGGVVHSASFDEARAKAALAAFDTGTLLSAARATVGDGAPTGLNLCDLHLLARL